MRGEYVVPGQEMLYTNDEGQEIWTRVASAPIRDTNGHVTWQASVISDIDAFKRSLEALRKSEEQQAFLLKISDMLRLLAAPAAIQGEAARLLGERLGADRALYAEHNGDTIVVHRD